MDAWLQSVQASMCPCVTEWGMSAALLVRNVETTWNIFIVVTHSHVFAPHTDPQQKRRLIDSCVGSKRHFVYYHGFL